MIAINDETIIRCLQADDKSGLEKAIECYREGVFAIAHKMLSSPEDCEEVVSDTFFKLWRSRKQIDISGNSLKAYISAIARNSTIDKLRSRKRAAYISEYEDDIGFEVDFTDMIAAETNKKIIAKCVSSMKQPDRNIFIARYYYSCAVKDIADMYGLNPKKVENILLRGKKRLKAKLLKGGIIL